LASGAAQQRRYNEGAGATFNPPIYKKNFHQSKNFSCMAIYNLYIIKAVKVPCSDSAPHGKTINNLSINDHEENTATAMRKQTRTQEEQPSSKEPTLAERIKRKRAREGLSQSQAAQAWSINLGTLQHWEQGFSTPRGLARVALEKILKENK